MKKATMFVLAAALTISMTGCGSSQKETEAPKTEAATEAKTEAKTEAATEKATEAKTEAATEKATEAETEAKTEAATEKATEAKTEAATEKATEAETEAKTEAATEKETEAKTEAVTEKATETETEKVTEAESETETETESEVETEKEKATEAESESETEVETETETESEVETEKEKATEAESESETEVETETETEKATEAESESETEVETETETESEVETEKEKATEAESESETEVETETETESEVETEKEKATEAESEAETEIETETETESEVETEKEKATKAESESETKVETETETEKVTEKGIEKATEAETEAATEAKTEKATEAETETEKVTEAATEAGTEEETEEATEKATEPVEVQTESEAFEAPEGTHYKAALLLNGNLGDKSFYDSANEGLERLRDELGEDVFDFKVEQMGGTAADEAKWEPTLLDYCDTGAYDVIIMGTWQMADALARAAEEYPDQKFIFFDEEFDFEGNGNPENVYNVMYKQNEVSYLVGAAAAMMTTDDSIEGIDPDNHIIGFLGGMDNSVINDFLVGYIQGAADIDPDIEVAVGFVGDFVDSTKGKDIALSQYQSGADVGFNVAGNAGLGQIEAAKDEGKYAFGVDSDQAALLPDYADYIPTSALKNVGQSLYLAIQKDMLGELKYGTEETYGFKEGGVALVKDAHYEKMLPENIRTKLDELEQSIIDGDIVVNTSADMDQAAIEALKESVKVGR
ncbi:MAG: BMP family ABC transporter substrate-binding protein [Lachnospiraceae bacterium]